MNSELKKKSKKYLEIFFLKSMKIASFGKNMGNVRKHWAIKILITEQQRKYLVSEPNYHTKQSFQKRY